MLLVILALAALAILAGVVLVSMGKGGELSEFPPDVPPLNLPDTGRLGAVDVMALQLPLNLIGYHTQSVDETLRRVAEAISARDAKIALLEQRVSELMSNRLYARQEACAAPGNGPRTEHEPPAAPLALPAESDPSSNGDLPAPDDEPASADHEPATWADPTDDGLTPDEAGQDTPESDISAQDAPERDASARDGAGSDTPEGDAAAAGVSERDGAEDGASPDGVSGRDGVEEGASPDGVSGRDGVEDGVGEPVRASRGGDERA